MALIVAGTAAWSAQESQAANTVLWQIGAPDDSSKEFSDYRRANPEAVAVAAESKAQLDPASVSKGLKASINPSMEIAFTLPAVPKHGALFSFKLLHAPKGGAQMGVFSNGVMAGLIQLWGTHGTASPYRWQKTYRLYIPSELLMQGANILRLTAPRPMWSETSVDQHMWWEWDYLRLEALAAPVREPIHGTVCYLGTTMKHSANDFFVNDDTLRIAPVAFRWMGIAYSGNTIRADFWYDVARMQPRRLEYLQLLRDFNMTVIVDNISCSHYRVGPDGKMPQKAKNDLQKFLDKYGALVQWYEIGNEPCMFGGGFTETIELARYLNEIKPPHLKTTACGWAYGGGKGTPKNWDANVVSRRAVEEHCQATNGHSYGFSYADNKGGSFVETLATYQGVQDGWPVEYVNTETGTNDWHSDKAENAGPNYASTQPQAQAFDRIMRAHVAVVDRTMQHAAIFDDFGLFKAPTKWSEPETLSAFPGFKGQDTRLKTFRRLALAYATHGAPLPYVVLNRDEVANKLVYFRAVDTAAIPALPGSGGTSDKVLLNFVNFENSPQTLRVRVKMPDSATYSGERLGAGNTFAEARSAATDLKADPWIELSAALGPGDSVQYILTPPKPVVPYTPTSVEATPGDKQNMLTWAGSSGATSYVVEREPPDTQTFVCLAKDIKECRYTDTTAKNRVPYFYRVAAANAAGESSGSVAVGAAAGTPLPPVRVEATPGDKKVTIRFTPGVNAKGYNVRRGVRQHGMFEIIARNLQETEFVDANVSNGTTYYYLVASLNDNYTSSYTMSVPVTPVPPPPAPGRPSACADSGRVVLSWPASPGAMNYNVKRATTADGPYALIFGGVAESLLADNNAKDGTTYHYRVSAVNQGVEGADSEAVSATPAAEPLPEVWKQADVGAVKKPGIASHVAATGMFTVTGSGDDIWDMEGFHYVYQPLAGDGALSARVVSFDDTHEWAKIGVMIRGALEGKPAMAIMAVTPGKGCGLSFRSAPNGKCGMHGGNAQPWVKIERRGEAVIGLVSPDGKTWTEFGSAKLALDRDAFIGLAVCSHDGNRLNKALFDSVVLSGGSVRPP
ncbi:MAG: polysaccharide lyase family protein [Planctomycetota bacterium]|nr:polysaccharide lyase family protein [Planctomycetota bacterium]